MSLRSSRLNIEELKQKLENEKDEKKRVHLLSKLTNAFLHEDHDLSTKYGNEALELASKIDYQKGIANTLRDLANVFIDKGEYEKARELLSQAKDRYEKLKDTAGMAKTLHNIGESHLRQSTFEKALFYFFEALKLKEKIQDEASIAISLNAVGVAYNFQFKFDLAADFYQKAVAIREKIGDKKGASYCYNNLGIISRSQNKFQEALAFYHKSLEIKKSFNDQQGIAYCFNNIGLIYIELESYKEGTKYHLEALKLFQKLDFKLGIGMVLGNLARGFFHSEQYDKAIKYATESVKLAKVTGVKDQLREAFKHISRSYASKKDFEKAFDYFKKYNKVNKAIFSQESDTKMAEMQAKYESDKKEKEKEIYRLRMKEMQLIALSAQMNPHFIFNCLNSINRFILADDSVKASRYLTKFSKLIRLILENSQKPTISLENELAMIESYMQLEANRFKHQFEYKINIGKGISKIQLTIPSMLIQPFVENAIWHGLMHKKDKGLIVIEISKKKKSLICVVEDNGIGRAKAAEIKQKKLSGHKSLGLKVTEDRLKILHDLKMQKPIIAIEDLKTKTGDARGTRVIISIPLS